MFSTGRGSYSDPNKDVGPGMESMWGWWMHGSGWDPGEHVEEV